MIGNVGRRERKHQLRLENIKTQRDKGNEVVRTEKCGVTREGPRQRRQTGKIQVAVNKIRRRGGGVARQGGCSRARPSPSKCAPQENIGRQIYRSVSHGLTIPLKAIWTVAEGEGFGTARRRNAHNVGSKHSGSTSGIFRTTQTIRQSGLKRMLKKVT